MATVKPINEKTGNAGSGTDLQASEKVAFGRSKKKSRESVEIEIPSKVKSTLPKVWSYDETKESWEDKTPDKFNLNILDTSRKALLFDEDKVVGSGNQKVSNKVWQAVVLDRESTVVNNADEDGKPTGKPAKYTHYNIPIPAYLTIWGFANTVYKTLKTDNKVVNTGDEQKENEIEKFVTPDGKTISVSVMEALLSASKDPNKREDRNS